jgi:site-specific DNA recombinase
MRVALYARVSTRRQAQAQTVEQQLERLTGHTRQQGWDVPLDHIFRDDGYSGASLRRPGLDRLRDRAAARALDLVVIAAPDRLARNYVHQVLLLEELEGHGCAVQFLDRPMGHDPHDQLLLQIRGAVAEYERTLITERMRRGRQRKLEAGLMLPWTRPPFGYRVDPDRPRDPAGVRVEEAEAAIVREMFAWYAEEAHSFCSLARLLERRGIRTATGLARWNLASIRALLTNPAYAGQVYGNRWHRRGTLERRSATAPAKHSAMSRVDAPREEWILVAEIPPLVSQEQFDRVQARLASNRRFAQRNNKAHPYLLRNLVSCGLCGLACLARTAGRQRYYSCTGKLPALFSHREQKCPSRLSPAGRLDELVWADLRKLLTHPEQVTRALARAHGGNWLPQELQARQQGLRRGQAGLGQQLERLTDAYLVGVVALDEYRRRRGDLERRQQQLEEQARQLEAQADRQKELAGLSNSIGEFCRRVRLGLDKASFEQQRSLIELLVDRVIVADGEVEIRYVMPTDRAGEQVRFCHLRLAYLGGIAGIVVVDDLALNSGIGLQLRRHAGTAGQGGADEDQAVMLFHELVSLGWLPDDIIVQVTAAARSGRAGKIALRL